MHPLTLQSCSGTCQGHRCHCPSVVMCWEERGGVTAPHGCLEIHLPPSRSYSCWSGHCLPAMKSFRHAVAPAALRAKNVSQHPGDIAEPFGNAPPSIHTHTAYGVSAPKQVSVTAEGSGMAALWFLGLQHRQFLGSRFSSHLPPCLEMETFFWLLLPFCCVWWHPRGASLSCSSLSEDQHRQGFSGATLASLSVQVCPLYFAITLGLWIINTTHHL